MSMTVLNMVRDINGYNTFALPFSNTMVATTLSVGAEQTAIVPSTGSSLFKDILAVFNIDPGSTLYVANGATATIPGSSFASTNSELNPAPKIVKAGDVLHFITPDTARQTTVSFYACKYWN